MKNDLTIHNVREQIVGVDAQVPLLDGSQRQYVNLDNAASTPALRPVHDKVNEFMTWYSSVHRGTGFKSQIATEAYELAHDIVGCFVGADLRTNTVIFGKNTTEAINKLARRLPLERDDVVLCSLMEHHSNDLPWRLQARLIHVAVNDDGSLDEDDFDRLLRQHAGRVKLVAVTGASNVTGYLKPIHRLAEKAHAAGARILVDAAQLAPHRAIDMRPDDDPGHLDFVALSAHKMYAPYGTGALVGPIEVFGQGTPDVVGGGTVDIVTVDDVRWAGPPDRDEAGSPNVVGAVALAQAILCLQEIGMEALAHHEAELTAHALRRLRDIDGVEIYGLADPERAGERVGVIPFNVRGVDHYKVAAVLSFEGRHRRAQRLFLRPSLHPAPAPGVERGSHPPPGRTSWPGRGWGCPAWCASALAATTRWKKWTTPPRCWPASPPATSRASTSRTPARAPTGRAATSPTMSATLSCNRA